MRRSWATTAVLLSLPGFLFNCQPSEPYLTAYLKKNKGLSSDTLDDSVWPWNTYAGIVSLLVVALVTESAGPFPLLVLGALTRLTTRLLLLMGTSVSAMAGTQVTYAFASAINTVYFGYVYIATDAPDYDGTTAFVHAAWHMGNLVGSGMGQAYVSSYGGVHKAPLDHLFYASLAFTVAGAVSLAALPSPKRELPPSLLSLCARSSNARPEAAGAGAGAAAAAAAAAATATTPATATATATAARAAPATATTPAARAAPATATTQAARAAPAQSLSLLPRDLLSRLASPVIAVWSLWWVTSYAANYIIGNYYQTLFSDIDPDGNKEYGAIEMAMEAGAVLGSALPWAWSATSHLAAPASVTVGALLAAVVYALVVVFSHNLDAAYALTIASVSLFAALYATACNAISLTHVALTRGDSAPEPHTFSVLFTLNTLLALSLATAAQAAAASSHFATLDYYTMAAIASAATAALAAAFTLAACLTRNGAHAALLARPRLLSAAHPDSPIYNGPASNLSVQSPLLLHLHPPAHSYTHSSTHPFAHK